MKKIVTLVLLLLSFSSFAIVNDCSQLPQDGNISFYFNLADGTPAEFRARLTILTTPAYGNSSQYETSHTYYNPEVIIDGESIVLNSEAADLIAKKMGYQARIYGLLRTNPTFFGRESLILDGSKNQLVLRDGHSGDLFHQRDGYVNFYHPVCANWRY